MTPTLKLVAWLVGVLALAAVVLAVADRLNSSSMAIAGAILVLGALVLRALIVWGVGDSSLDEDRPRRDV